MQSDLHKKEFHFVRLKLLVNFSMLLMIFYSM